MRTFIALFLFVLVLESNAQMDNYSLKDYKMPVIVRNQLDFNPGINFRKYEFSEFNNFSDNKWFDFDTDINYHRYSNNEKAQTNTGIFLNGGFYNYDDIYINGTQLQRVDRNSKNINLYMYHESFNYLNEQVFFYFKPEGFINRSDNQQTYIFTDIFDSYYNESKTIYNNITVEGQVYMGVGFGRLEFVQDYRQMLYILEEFHKAGILDRFPTTEEFTKLANVASEVINARVFDSRKKRQYEITLLDKAFRELNLISTYESEYYTILYDNWLYAINPVRRSGSRFYGGYAPKVLNGKDMETKDEITILGDNIFMKYEYELPISNNLQFSIWSLLSGVKEWYKDEPADLRMERSFFSVSTFQMGYYPNSRTTVNSGIEAILLRQNDKIEYSTKFTLSSSYFISPRVRFNASMGIPLLKSTTNMLTYDNYQILPIDRSVFFSAGFVGSVF
ncbi:MAG: hypothetical protein OEY34_07995 [Cyclobacteriaceae bacterium]|nr:hypothetical protein [Cyclobacteriaceae bacterium]